MPSPVQAMIEAQRLATSLGAEWAGGSEDQPPVPLDAAIIFAPVGSLVPLALRAVCKGGRVVCAGIHMSDIPSFPYHILWEERQLLSVANLTRGDGIAFFKIAAQRRHQDPHQRVPAAGKQMRCSRNCAPGRSPAPPCCSHDCSHRHRHGRRGRPAAAGARLPRWFQLRSGRAAASVSTPMPRWFFSEPIGH